MAVTAAAERRAVEARARGAHREEMLVLMRINIGLALRLQGASLVHVGRQLGELADEEELEVEELTTVGSR